MLNPEKTVFNLENSPNIQPFVLKLYHKSFEGCQRFLKDIDPELKLPGNANNLKGVQIFEINKNLLMEVYWGENMTEFEKYWIWLNRRKTFLDVEGLIELDGDISHLAGLIENGE